MWLAETEQFINLGLNVRIQIHPAISISNASKRPLSGIGARCVPAVQLSCLLHATPKTSRINGSGKSVPLPPGNNANKQDIAVSDSSSIDPERHSDLKLELEESQTRNRKTPNRTGSRTFYRQAVILFESRKVDCISLNTCAPKYHRNTFI